LRTRSKAKRKDDDDSTRLKLMSDESHTILISVVVHGQLYYRNPTISISDY
jgi:hypothetical protein